MTKKLKFFAGDLESTGLLHHLREQGSEARLHNFALMSTASDKYTILHPMEDADRAKLQAILDRDDVVLVIHNGLCYDLEALKFFGFDVSKVKIVDTLYLAWYLDFHAGRNRFGLESYGEDFGVPKPPIEDWENLTQEDYDHRVYGDIKIQKALWLKLCKQFAELYNIPEDDMLETNVYNHHCMKYIMWKGEQMRIQQENMWKFDYEKAAPMLKKIEFQINEKIEALTSVMPKVPVYATRKRPAKPFKQNGELSSTGLKWKELTEEMNLPFEHADEIRVITKYNPPNPASPAQVKDWLFDLGWVPQTYEFKKDDSGERKIPQIYVKGSGGEVCSSVQELAERYPEVGHLVGLGVLKHRKGMVANWLNNHRNGYLTARAAGFTNTLRLKHAELVNIPSGRVFLGSQVRALLTVRDDANILLGSDLSSLENRLKFHFQMPLDPDYVKAQMSKDFDPHLSLALLAGLLTEDEVNFYKIEEKGFDMPDEVYTDDLKEMLAKSDEWKHAELARIEKIRGMGKAGNYACLPMDTKVAVFDDKYLGPVRYVDFKNLKDTDQIVQYCSETGEYTASPYKYKHFYKDAEVVTVKIKPDGIVTFKCTMNHRWLVRFDNGREGFAELSDIISNNYEMNYAGVWVKGSDLEIIEVTKEDVFCLTTESSSFLIKQGRYYSITGNCQYGAGAKTVARTAKVSLDVGQQIVEGYRMMNWSIDVIASNTSIKKTSFGDFQLNPINKMYYPLKTAKDRFSTLIQGSGAYVLDLWLMFIFKRLKLAHQVGIMKDVKLLGQFHDEIILEFNELQKAEVEKLVNDAMGDVNNALKLHVDLACDIKFGKNYSDIH